ncbi:sodium/calcium exchanger protein [Aspergillus costaricaensis CBS 115574]|uniref:Sodium/calcium exchanger protein n=1 Tax=Aspergillus costaricaensis CBS 115574 TaxID=1448317 RepID=A0ACD1ID33_9EURO|nr:sodium/calcium exchanger protein [Aspergillus costaricaensis CBS 115574]RAK87917.1 sodium/calcium exchanger protein [Aspergillus costaricaensis CBS 115574]
MSPLLIPKFLSRRPASRKRGYSARPFWACLLAFSLLAILSWVSGRLAEPTERVSVHNVAQLRKRDNALECRLVRQAKDQCAFVLSNCADHEEGLFSYLQFYYCTAAKAKPIAFIIIVLWLSLLFSTIGIAASDFLCVDLSTLASVLGLSESLTGVTFLAFGNGSPDVFSTFAAMRSNSGSLAIGELLGAASFITSVVAGSMALVRPFRVARRSFVRDVGFFILAVAFSMFLLGDGRLHVWESAMMVALYCFYVVLVVTWHWYLTRQRRSYERNLAARSHFHIPDNQELDIEEEEEDDPGVASEATSLLHGEDFDALERSGVPAWQEGEEDDETRNRYLAEIRDNMHVYRPTTRRRNTLNPIRPSLVGALEFQSVLSSLQRSRNIHRNESFDLERCSDGERSRSHSRLSDNASVVSHPRASRPSLGDRLSPHGGTGSARTRAVSANAAADLKLDTSMFTVNSQQPLLTVRRPSVETQSPSETTGALASDQSPGSTLTPQLAVSQAPSTESNTHLQSPNLLAPPGAFHSPTYQVSSSRPRSPLPLSPRGTTLSPGPANAFPESPTSPFPPFQDVPSFPSSGAPSLRLPAASSPTERLQIHDSAFDAGSNRTATPTWWPHLQLTSQPILPTLFPTLAGWKSKSFWERLLGIVAAPSVLLLTITLPVVEPVQPETGANAVPVIVTSADGDGAPSPAVRLPEDSPLLRALDQESISRRNTVDQNGKPEPIPRHSRFDSELPAIQSNMDSPPPPAKEWCLWLVWVQLFVGPFFVALMYWTTVDSDLDVENLLLPSMVSLLFSLICTTCLMISTRHDLTSQPPGAWRPVLAFLGFIVAICWIATIATEVVSLLKTLGVILNISDSLLGLTVFAVGNSLGDLVADITVARLGYPVMALSACFGGPMLNILLGIGLGGLYMTMNANPEAIAATGGSYEIEVSKVLVISGATLLITLIGLLIVVPLNKWRMDQKIGWGLVVLWVISTVGNVLAELLF